MLSLPLLSSNSCQQQRLTVYGAWHRKGDSMCSFLTKIFPKIPKSVCVSLRKPLPLYCMIHRAVDVIYWPQFNFLLRVCNLATTKKHTLILAAAHRPQNLVRSVTRKFSRKFTHPKTKVISSYSPDVPCHTLYLSEDTSGERAQCDNMYRTLSVKKTTGRDDARQKQRNVKIAAFSWRNSFSGRRRFGRATVIHEVFTPLLR